MARPRKSEGLVVNWEERGSYPVVFADNMFAVENTAVVETLRAVSGDERPRVMLVADMNVVQRTEGLGTSIGKYVQAHGLALAGAPVVIGGGEKIKTDGMQSVLKIVEAALEAKIGKNDIMMAIGGGTILDVAGYAVSQVRGGVKLVRVPTTIASMTDAAFADNAAMDNGHVKDALRVPCRPAAVIVDVSYAKTVLDGVWRGGVGELVRFAAVKDATLMKKIAKNAEALKERNFEVLSDAVRDCVSAHVKWGATGFALWSAARLEAMSGWKLPHGYAVPIGICIDCAYAVEKGLLKEDHQEFICRALADCGALDGLSHSHHLLSQADNILFGLDAWRLSNGSERITIPSGIGKSEDIDSVDREAMKKVIKEFLAVSTGA